MFHFDHVTHHKTLQNALLMSGHPPVSFSDQLFQPNPFRSTMAPFEALEAKLHVGGNPTRNNLPCTTSFFDVVFHAPACEGAWAIVQPHSMFSLLPASTPSSPIVLCKACVTSFCSFMCANSLSFVSGTPMSICWKCFPDSSCLRTISLFGHYQLSDSCYCMICSIYCVLEPKFVVVINISSSNFVKCCNLMVVLKLEVFLQNCSQWSNHWIPSQPDTSAVPKGSASNNGVLFFHSRIHRP